MMMMMMTTTFYFAPVRERCIIMNVCVCPSLRPSVHPSVRERISENTRPNFIQFSMRVIYDWSSSGGVAICYVLPILWMTSFSVVAALTPLQSSCVG